MTTPHGATHYTNPAWREPGETREDFEAASDEAAQEYYESYLKSVHQYEDLTGTTANPTISEVRPPFSNADPDEGDQPLTVIGTRFTENTVINWDESPVETVFVDANEVSCTVTKLPSAGDVELFVDNGKGRVSETVVYTFHDPLTVTNTDPETAVAGSGAQTISVLGTAFGDYSVVNWDGVDLDTTFIDDMNLSVEVTAPAAAEDHDVYVSNGEGNVSNTVTFSFTAAP